MKLIPGNMTQVLAWNINAALLFSLFSFLQAATLPLSEETFPLVIWTW